MNTNNEAAMNPNDGGPFHPCQPLDAQGNPCGAMEYGASLRDHFAGLAMQGIFANPTFDGATTREHLAKTAYEMADAMLVARARESGV